MRTSSVSLLMLCLVALGMLGMLANAQGQEPVEGMADAVGQEVVCDLQTIRCSSGQWISKVPPYCDFEQCAPMMCSDDDEEFMGCSGEFYENKCAANQNFDYCDDSIRLEGQESILQSCSDLCMNTVPTEFECAPQHLASDGTCIRGFNELLIEEPEDKDGDEDGDEDEDEDEDDGAIFSNPYVQEVYDYILAAGTNLMDILETNLRTLGDEDEDISELLSEMGSDLQESIEKLIKDITERSGDFDEEEIEDVVGVFLKENLGITLNDMEDNGVDMLEIIEDAKEEDTELILEENDGEHVEAVLKIPGEPLSPRLSLIGPRRAVQYHQENFTDYMSFSLAEVKEIDQMGEVVKSVKIDRLLKKAPINTVASSVNLGTEEEPKRALEILIEYPLDEANMECSDDDAQAFSLDPAKDPSLLLRVYLIGREAVTINYLGDDVLLHPFTVKFTFEANNWNFCSEENRLQIVMDYKYSEKADESKVEDIEDLDLSDDPIDPEEASFDTIMDQNAMDDVEEEIDDMMEDYGFEDEEDKDDDEDKKDENDRRKLLQNNYLGFFTDADGGDNNELTEDIEEAMAEDLDKDEKEALSEAIVKLQEGRYGGRPKLRNEELKAVRKLLRQSRRRVYKRTKDDILDELNLMRREKFAVGASLKMMRKRLKNMRRTFSSGVRATGYGNTVMFMPGTGLINGAKQDVEVEMKEKGRQRMQMKVTMPYCGETCVYDPTIEMTEDAKVVPDPPSDAKNSKSSAWSTNLFSVFGSLVVAVVSFMLIL